MKLTIDATQRYPLLVWGGILAGLLLFPTVMKQLWPVVFIALMVLFGVTHWINDLDHLAQTFSGRSDRRLLVRYGLIMLLVVAGWITIPLLTVLVFIIISAYHFWVDNREKYPTFSLKGVFSFVWWVWLLFGLFYLHRNQVTELLAPLVWDISMLYTATQWIWYGALCIVWLLWLYRSITDRSVSWSLLYELIIYSLVFAIAVTWDLYRSFWFYFWICHSLPEIIDLTKTHNHPSSKQYMHFVSKHKTIFLRTLILAWAWYLLISSIRPNLSLLLIFFMFLAVVTFPHVLLEAVWDMREGE